MAQRERYNLLSALLKSRRVIEWSIIAAVLICLVWALEHQVRVVRGQGERVAVRATLASLRAALVIDQLTAEARSRDANPAASPTKTVVKNPFTLLQGVPPNYAGERPMRDIFSVPPGSWVYDAECACIGYRLLYPQWLEPEQAADTIWLRIGASAGESRLTPLADYRWFGYRLN